MRTKNLLLIFTRNPELGKCKTRLAATIGPQAALDVYKTLLAHTMTITRALPCDKQVHYSVKIRPDDQWDATIYKKKQQQGTDLGQRMQHAFAQGFADGYQNIIIIGSDMYDLSAEDIATAFTHLETYPYVIGPAEDGGYYLLGIQQLHPTIFHNKAWGTSTVLKDTLQDLEGSNYKLLPERNDVDYYEDIKDIPVFQQFLNQQYD